MMNKYIWINITVVDLGGGSKEFFLRRFGIFMEGLCRKLETSSLAQCLSFQLKLSLCEWLMAPIHLSFHLYDC